jgi:hypothetical protein
VRTPQTESALKTNALTSWCNIEAASPSLKDNDLQVNLKISAALGLLQNPNPEASGLGKDIFALKLLMWQ